MASAWATLAVYSSMTLVSYYLGKKHYPVPYQINKVILYIVISILFSVISFYKFQENYYISTLLLVAFIGIIFILEKNTIRQLRLK
jgi:membrane-associated HD superfamily phosphohydrolase